jgi:hypothetical protein
MAIGGARILTLATSFVQTYGRLRHRGRPAIYSVFTRPVDFSGTTFRRARFLLQLTSRRANLHSHLTSTTRGLILSRNRTYTQVASAFARPNTRTKKPEYTGDQTTPTSAILGPDILKPPTSDSSAEKFKATSKQLLRATSQIARTIKDDYPHQQFELGDELEDERALGLKSQLDMADQAKIIDGTAIAK